MEHYKKLFKNFETINFSAYLKLWLKRIDLKQRSNRDGQKTKHIPV